MNLDETAQDVLDSLTRAEQVDLRNRFAYHRPSPERAEEHQEVRDLLLGVAASLSAVLPPGREKSLALTKLEEAMFWGNAAIARQGALD